MIIEFTGLIGSGKSTLAQDAKRFFQSAGFIALSPDEAAWICFERSSMGQALFSLLPTAMGVMTARWAFALHQRLVYPFLFSLVYSGLVLHIFRSSPALHTLPFRHRQTILRFFFRVAAQSHYLRGHLLPGEVVIFEEGLIHRAINLYAWEPGNLDMQAVEEYLGRIPASDLAILVNAPLVLCLERAKARGLPVRLKDKDPQVVERFMENSACILAVAARTREPRDLRDREHL